MSLPLTDAQRRLIHDLALDARDLLTKEARELLEGTYGLYSDGRLDPIEKLPQVLEDAEAGETYRRMARFIDDESRAGLPRAEAVEKLTKEIAFTHLNRLVAFKMMEARKLIRGALDKGVESNGFKFYLADPGHADALALYERGNADAAYRYFLLWQAGQVSRELAVLFDPDSLPSRLFPRPRALARLIAMLNAADLETVWRADETIGWLYQFFNEREKAEVFDRLYNAKQKLRRQDIPAATQLFTPNWIVRFLVQNTLGRLWVEMHPDTRLAGTQLLAYLVPLEQSLASEADDGEARAPARPRPTSRPIGEITLLDPACGAMHFGLVAFDLFAAMYREEFERAGEDGWPAMPSVGDEAAIPAAIIERNLFGIDIDLRAVQLSSLALYLKAKSLNPKAQIAGSNLVCADVLPLNGTRLGTFIREAHFTRPVYERLIRGLWERLRDVSQVGSLMRLEREMGALIAQERARVGATPLFAGLTDEFEREAAEAEYWDLISAQIIQALDEFARQQAREGNDQAFFTGEAVKGLRLTEVMLRDYDVVVTNPPYSGAPNLNEILASYLATEYPDAKGDLYAAFIQRCTEFLTDGGRLGMITQQSFMFISSYERLRAWLTGRAVIEAALQLGPRAFAEISGEVVNTVAFAFRLETDAQARSVSSGVYYRVNRAGEGDGKRQAFELSLRSGNNAYQVVQSRLDVIPGSPWVYWVDEVVRALFEKWPALGASAEPRQGLATTDNARFVRSWWEVGARGLSANGKSASYRRLQQWFPYMKGGSYRKWHGNQEFVVNWRDDGAEIKAEIVKRYPYLNGNWEWVAKNTGYYLREGLTFTDLTSGSLSMRWMPPGFIFDHAGNCLFPISGDIWSWLGLLNSSLFGSLMHINPTFHFYIGDFKRMPVPPAATQSSTLRNYACVCTRNAMWESWHDETAFDFVAPLPVLGGIAHRLKAIAKVKELESRINDEVYGLYGIGDADRTAIEAELAGGPAVETEDENTGGDEDAAREDVADELTGVMSREELAVCWVSYAVGIVLGRFQPGIPGALGSAVYRRGDFAIGSLPAPDEAEFNELVGPADQFAYLDVDGDRHVFPAEVETSLRALSLPDGIAVLDEGHPRDLPALVGRALGLMIGAGELAELQAALGQDVRSFLGKEFFTRWHLRWYRKRPVYWPLHSTKRSYGFVLFHERVDRMTLYTLQREYLDYKLNAVRQQAADLATAKALQSGAAKRATEREEGRVAALLDELTEFAKTLERIVRAGYEPAATWIDDGVILRLAPLWELLPLWKAEPKKYWERLERGDFDWSHIAMKYWPDRVREKCKTNKSFAIAHGVEGSR